MELATEALSYNNQNIASKAPKLLLCSSIASVSDQGSNKGVTPLAGIGKEHPELNWYYLYLPNKELKRYIGVFSGRKSVNFVSHQVKQKKDTFVSRYFPILRRTTGNASSNAPILRRNILPVVIPPG